MKGRRIWKCASAALRLRQGLSLLARLLRWLLLPLIFFNTRFAMGAVITRDAESALTDPSSLICVEPSRWVPPLSDTGLPRKTACMAGN